MRRLLFAFSCACIAHFFVLQLPWFQAKIRQPELPADQSIHLRLAGSVQKAIPEKPKPLVEKKPITKTVSKQKRKLLPKTKIKNSRPEEKAIRQPQKQKVVKPVLPKPKKKQQPLKKIADSKPPVTETKIETREKERKIKTVQEHSQSLAQETREPEATIVKATPIYRKNPKPEYPTLCRKRGQQGTVVLKVTVRRDGSVEDAIVSQGSGYKLLDKSALKTVHRWRFIPGSRNGRAVDMEVLVPVQFVLQ